MRVFLGRIMLIFTILLMCINFNYIEVNALEKENKDSKHKILIINSYHNGYEWSDDLTAEIERRIKDSKQYDLYIEYMDTTRNTKEDYLKELYDFYKGKYNDYDFELIIASDNAALDFILKYGKELFNDTPIVFCGINDKESYDFDNYGNITGVFEEPYMEGVLNSIINIHPNTDKIIVIYDHEPTSVDNKRVLEEEYISYKSSGGKVQVSFIDGNDFLAIQNTLDKEVGNMVLFIIGNIYDENNEYVSPRRISRHLYYNYNYPIYTRWEESMNNGATGCVLPNGSEYAKKAIPFINKALGYSITEQYSLHLYNLADGKDIKYLFDYNNLERFNIDTDNLPKDSIIINEMKNRIVISKNTIFTISSVLSVVLTIIVVFLLLNIRTRKKAEVALRESEERLRSLINATPDLICFKDAQGKWIECNDAILDVIGIEREQCIGKTDAEIKDLSIINGSKFVEHSNIDSMVFENKTVLRFEDKIILRDGTVRIYDAIKVPLFVEKEERKGIVVLERDITDRKNVIKELEQSKERYSMLIDLLPEGLFICDKGKIVFANKAAVELLKADSQEEVIGRSIDDVIEVSEEYVKIKEEMFKLLYINGGSIPNVERTLIGFDQKKIDILYSAFSFLQENKMYCTILIKDISEKKKAEELKKKEEKSRELLMEAQQYNKIRTEFFANISHELRTPLNVMFSSLQLLQLYIKEGKIIDSSNKMDKGVYILKQNSFRLLRLVNNLIDITKIDSGFFDIRLTNNNIVKIVEDITISVADYIESKGIELIFDTEEEEEIIACDPEKIERIMLNLLSNSIKFTEAGGSINVNMHKHNNWVYISVKDTGAGIPEEKIDMVFERFRQVDKSLARPREGSGIGLSLVKSLVELHGGSIELKSEINKGSEFIIKLPIKKVHLENEHIQGNISDHRIERIQLEFSDIYN